MKLNIYQKAGLKLLSIISVVVITGWVLLTSPTIFIACLIGVVIRDLENDESQRNYYADKLMNMSLELMVLPYKLLGVCDSFKSYVDWFQFNM